MTDDLPAMLTVEEVADVLRVRKRTVYERLRTGELKGKKFGKRWLISKNEIRELLAEAS